MCSICYCNPDNFSNLSCPQVYERIGTGIRIEDLTEKYYDRVLNIFEKNYVHADFLCQITGLNKDDKSIKLFLENILFHLKNNSSIIAIDESLSKELRGREVVSTEPVDDIAGIFIMRAIKLIDYGRVTSRVKITEGEALKKCVHLRACINKKIDLFAKYKCNSIFRYYYLCILPKYRNRETSNRNTCNHKMLPIDRYLTSGAILLSVAELLDNLIKQYSIGLGFEMMKCGYNVARSKGISVVMGIFCSWSLQNWAEKIGMKVVHEINYDDWKSEDGSVIFNNIRPPNQTCAMMVKILPRPTPFVKVETPKDEVQGAKDDKGQKGKK